MCVQNAFIEPFHLSLSLCLDFPLSLFPHRRSCTLCTRHSVLHIKFISTVCTLHVMIAMNVLFVAKTRRIIETKTGCFIHLFVQRVVAHFGQMLVTCIPFRLFAMRCVVLADRQMISDFYYYCEYSQTTTLFGYHSKCCSHCCCWYVPN